MDHHQPKGGMRHCTGAQSFIIKVSHPLTKNLWVQIIDVQTLQPIILVVS